MSNDTFDPLVWDNAQGFLGGALIKQINRLAVSPHLDVDDRRGLLALSSAVAALPAMDPQYSCAIDIDFTWDDLNWVGRLNFFRSEFTLWSSMNQLEWIKPELYGQWQHIALKLFNKEWGGASDLKHDPAHLWLWIRCFSRFIDRFYGWGDSEAHGVMKFNSFFGNFILHAPYTDDSEEIY